MRADALGWVRATTIGWFAGFLIMLAIIALSEAVGVHGQTVMGIGIGTGVGVWQSRYLKDRLARPGRWVVATVIGLSAPLALWDLSALSGGDVDFPLALQTSVAVGGLLAAIGQWRLLPRVRGTALWIPACTIGWTLPVAAVALGGADAVPAPVGTAVGLAGMFFGGVMLGAVTAGPLVRILRAAG